MRSRHRSSLLRASLSMVSTKAGQLHYIAEGLTTGAYSSGGLLWVKVPENIALYMVANRLVTEQLVRQWMPLWKQISDWSAVTIYVEWEDVEIARGETTVFRGDQVTVLRAS